MGALVADRDVRSTTESDDSRDSYKAVVLRRLVSTAALAVQRYPVWLAGVLTLCAVLAGALHFSWVSREVDQERATDEAAVLARTLSTFRLLYSRDVVARVRSHGIEATHDFATQDRAIPLPATFAIAIGDELGRRRPGLASHLYSPYPFPWRRETGGLRDAFAQNAWKTFAEDPEATYVQVDESDGETRLRYAIADVMAESCVECHNTHPDSPRRSWQIGDVRGVLEIAVPLGARARRVDAAVIWTFSALIVVVGLSIGMMSLALRGLKQSAQRTRALAVELTATNDTLRGEVEARGAAERTLRRSQERFRSIIEDSPAAIVSLDESGRIVYFNGGAREIFGVSAEQALGLPFDQLLAPGQTQALQRALARAHTRGDGRVESGVELIGRRSDRRTIPLDTTLSLWSDTSGGSVITLIATDASVRRTLQEEVLAASFDERSRLGRDLHDGLGQALVAIALRADILSELLVRQGIADAARAHELAAMLREAQERARSIAQGLSPLDLAGCRRLGETMARAAAHGDRLLGVHCTVDDQTTPRAVVETQLIHLYYIATEAITNAVKHGHAVNVVIRIRELPDEHIEISIADDGVSSADTPEPLGLGTRLMRYRAALIGGSLEFVRQPGGMTVVCRLTPTFVEGTDPS
jgi:PAS domain S-box-containing protein